MKKRIFVLLLTCLLACLVACGSNETVVLPEEEPLPPPTQMSEFLSIDEVKQATGIQIVESEQHNDGSAAYFSADHMNLVYIASQEMDAAAFDALREEMSQSFAVSEAPNLAEKAFWCEELLTLYAQADGIAVEIRVEYTPADAGESLLAARQLAVLLLDKM